MTEGFRQDHKGCCTGEHHTDPSNVWEALLNSTPVYSASAGDVAYLSVDAELEAKLEAKFEVCHIRTPVDEEIEHVTLTPSPFEKLCLAQMLLAAVVGAWDRPRQ